MMREEAEVDADIDAFGDPSVIDENKLAASEVDDADDDEDDEDEAARLLEVSLDLEQINPRKSSPVFQVAQVTRVGSGPLIVLVVNGKTPCPWWRLPMKPCGMSLHKRSCANKQQSN